MAMTKGLCERLYEVQKDFFTAFLTYHRIKGQKTPKPSAMAVTNMKKHQTMMRDQGINNLYRIEINLQYLQYCQHVSKRLHRVLEK